MFNPAEAWGEYCGAFAQRIPRYAVKIPGHSWTTKHGYLHDRAIQGHLEGTYSVAVLGAAYPLWACIDFDEKTPADVERARDALGLGDGQAMTFTSESPNSYHVLFRPEYNGRPPGIRLLGEKFKTFARENGLEVYPQWRHAVRLPFGPCQRPASENLRGLTSWEDAVYFFNKLDAYDLRNVRHSQLELELPAIARPPVPYVGEAVHLLAEGLQAPGTRHAATFAVLLYLWRNDIPQREAERITWAWIQKKHNGYSKDIARRPRAVQAEIIRQATHIYGRYDFGRVLPDRPALAHDGFVTRQDVFEIVAQVKGNIPRARFLHRLIHYLNPRRQRLAVGVSTARLAAWASIGTYGRYLREFEAQGILKRGRGYAVGAFSKSIRMTWPWAAKDSAILYDGRSVETFEGAVKTILKPGEFREVLEAVGRDRRRTYEAVRAVFDASPQNALRNSKEIQIGG